MRTQDECFEALLNYLEEFYALGMIFDEEMEEINKIAFEYYAQSENRTEG